MSPKAEPSELSEKNVRLSRMLALGGIAVALGGGGLGFVASLRPLSGYVLAVAVVLVGVSAWLLGRRPGEASEDADAKWRRELAIHASSMVLLVVFLLLALVELLAIPAALGHLKVFGDLALGFISGYPLLIAVLVSALAGATLLASRGPGAAPPAGPARTRALAAAGVTGAFILGTAAVGAGLAEGAGIQAERAIFVLAASLVSLFYFVKTWLRLPAYAEVSEWLERDERVKASGFLRKVVIGLLAIAAVGVVLSILPLVLDLPRGVGMMGAGVATLALLGATFNVGVSHIVPQLEMAMGDDPDSRRKRHILLSATSIVLTLLGLAVGVLTFLAFLAQAGGVAIFRSLLDAYVAANLGIFGFVLACLVGAVYLRTRVKTTVPYSDKLRAIALGMATLTIVLVFFGVFIGSGLAAGSGIEIENAVLVMGAAVLTLIQFVKARALLPGIIGLLRDAVKTSAVADKDTQETIQSRMIWTYVLGLVFILGFAGFMVATSLGVLEPPSSSLGTDLGFFVYVLGGIALLVVVVMRYFQSVNMDQRFATKAETAAIGKKRLTSEEVKRYLILGFSVGTAAILAIMGILVMAGVLTAIGPFAVEKKYSTDFFVFSILIGLGPYGWYHSREADRISAIDQKFPEFLRDLAESQRSGMTLTEAVATAAKGNYGLLTGEIRKMATQIEWGVSFSDALQRFAKRVHTPLIQRTVSLVVEASNSGGNVVDVLTAAADDAREIQQIVKERKQSMSIYVMIIYIAFAVFVGVIAVLNAQFIPEVSKAVSKADGVSIGGLNFKKFDEEDFKTVFFHAAIIQGFGGGIVGGIMAGGKPIHGLRHSFVLVLIAWVLFRVVIG
jgi:flagellar protein FlaJ